jgi:hypothetical protein
MTVRSPAPIPWVVASQKSQARSAASAAMMTGGRNSGLSTLASALTARSLMMPARNLSARSALTGCRFGGLPSRGGSRPSGTSLCSAT